MAGPLGVSNIILVSLGERGPLFRMCKFPQGPTLTFKIRNYSLIQDIITKHKKHTKHMGLEYTAPPLLVLSGFTSATETTDKALERDTLVSSMFENLFPPISPEETQVSDIRRVMLVQRRQDDPDNVHDSPGGYYIIRHYLINMTPVGVSKLVRNIANLNSHRRRFRIPNLSNATDISEALLGGGFVSESEAEDEDSHIEVVHEFGQHANKVQQSFNPVRSRKSTAQQQAVKLREIGPRIDLELFKIEEGLCDGKTLYHSYITKTEVSLIDVPSFLMIFRWSNGVLK